MDLYEQAKKYLSAIPPAISGQGGHSQTLNAARALVWGFELPEHVAMDLLMDWNQSCQPPWSERELQHKIKEAQTKPFDKPRGYLLSKGTTYVSRYSVRPMQSTQTNPQLPKMDYDLAGHEEVELPMGKRNGFTQLLETCFKPGEGVRVMSALDDQGMVRCDPNGGVVLSREEWLAKLEEKGGINALYYRLAGPPVGVYLGVNPMKQDGRGRDCDVTDYRHCLLEFDKISLTEQWLLILKSNVPCAAVIFSGKKSIHAWVKVDAKDRKEYDERANLLYNHFKAYKPDEHNKNPSRFSRCPDAKRGDSQQMLLALHIGAKSWTEWSKHLLVQGIGRTHTMREIEEHKANEDGKTVLGTHYLRKGQSCIITGPSGVGKSSLIWQMAICWALGRPCFGVAPAKALKILFVQAENDICDLHRMTTGIYEGLGIGADRDLLETLNQNMIVNHNVVDTGHDFIVSLQRLVDHHEPDLVIADPMLSFIGDDISRQEVVGRFCRNWLNPILCNSDVAFLGVHHTGKPPQQQEQKARKNQKRVRRSFTELQYTMFGSSELINWARATIVIEQQPDNTFEMAFCKRGSLAGAKHPNDLPTQLVFLEWARGGIFWVQTNPPEEVATATETDPHPTPTLKPSQAAAAVARANLHEFLAMVPKTGWTALEVQSALIDFAANQLGILLPMDKDGRKSYAAKQAVQRLIENHKLGLKEGLYVKGSNA